MQEIITLLKLPKSLIKTVEKYCKKIDRNSKISLTRFQDTMKVLTKMSSSNRKNLLRNKFQNQQIQKRRRQCNRNWSLRKDLTMKLNNPLKKMSLRIKSTKNRKTWNCQVFQRNSKKKSQTMKRIKVVNLKVKSTKSKIKIKIPSKADK